MAVFMFPDWTRSNAPTHNDYQYSIDCMDSLENHDNFNCLKMLR